MVPGVQPVTACEGSGVGVEAPSCGVGASNEESSGANHLGAVVKVSESPKGVVCICPVGGLPKYSNFRNYAPPPFLPQICPPFF